MFSTLQAEYEVKIDLPVIGRSSTHCTRMPGFRQRRKAGKDRAAILPLEIQGYRRASGSCSKAGAISPTRRNR